VVSPRPLEAATGVTVTELCDPPIVRRFVLLVGLCLVGFLLSRRGWKDVDDDRPVRRAAYIGAGMLLSGSGLLLWSVTFLFPRTWCWRV
jgi:hypothetical protein